MHLRRICYFWLMTLPIMASSLIYKLGDGVSIEPVFFGLHRTDGGIWIAEDRPINFTGWSVRGDGRQTRDYIYVADVVAANLAGLATDSNLTINVGTGIETDVLTLYEQLRQASGSDLHPRHGPAKPGEQSRSVISPRRAKELLGWEPRIELAEGLRRTYQSFA